MNNLKKNTRAGKVKILFFSVTLFFWNFIPLDASKTNLEGSFLEIKVLDKVSSKSNNLNIKIGKEKVFKNILIKPLKCKNSEFDDNPEITAYLQVRDLADKNNNEVFIFNDWMFSSSPSITPFDHPVYDVWLVGCY